MSINEEYLDGEYIEKNPTFHVEDSPWKARQILNGIEKCQLSLENVAEVGCGAGEILVQLSNELPKAKFTGYELSPQAYEMCKERANEKISFHHSDLFEDEKSFDLMLCIDVFEHVEDYFSFLRNLSKKASNFIFHIPLDMNTQMVARAEPIQRVRKNVGHIHYFSKDSALAILDDCGFEVEYWFYTPNGVDRPKTTAAKLAQIPRKIFQAMSLEMSARLLGGYSLLVVAKPKSGSQ